jgi:S1-C subfamily serine protease
MIVAIGGEMGPAASAEVRPDAAVLKAEAERVAAIKRASAATVAIFDAAGAGGGSGVIISHDGFALTNFHVVATSIPAIK